LLIKDTKYHNKQIRKVNYNKYSRYLSQQNYQLKGQKIKLINKSYGKIKLIRKNLLLNLH